MFQLSALEPHATRAFSSSLNSMSLLLYLDLLRIAQVFSLWRMRPRVCNRLEAVMETVSPVNVNLDLAISLYTVFAAGPHPPPVASHKSRMKFIPSFLQINSISKYDLLKFSYVFTATEPSSTDFCTISLLNPLVTARSNAAGAPLRHLGRYTSAGHLLACGSLAAPFS